MTLAATASVLEAADSSAGGGSNLFLILMMVVLAVFFFILPARRQKKARTAQQERLQALVPGTRVMTQFGLYGTVVEIDRAENRAVLETSPGSTITVHLQVVTTVLDENGNVPGSPEAAAAAARQGVTAPETDAAGTVGDQNPTCEAAAQEGAATTTAAGYRAPAPTEGIAPTQSGSGASRGPVINGEVVSDEDGSASGRTR